MIILGIDPGTAITGYGLVYKGGASTRSKLESLEYGCIQTSKDMQHGERLLALEKGITSLIKKHKPDVLAVETLFFFKNLKTIMPVSEARGVIILAGTKQKLPIYEFSPLQVKMAIAGYGRAEKRQVQRMVQEILELSELPRPDDAADGLGIAIACSFMFPNGIPLPTSSQEKEGLTNVLKKSRMGGRLKKRS